jgi:hypothetical protein
MLGKLENLDNNSYSAQDNEIVRFFGVPEPPSVSRSARGSKNQHENVRFEVLTAVLLKIQAVWDVMLRGLTKYIFRRTSSGPSSPLFLDCFTLKKNAL